MLASHHLPAHEAAMAETGPSAGSGRVAPPRSPEVDSARLLEGRREVLIRHGGEVYRLRHTRNDKLILTK